MNGRRAPTVAPADLPLLLLLASAGAAVWPAYDRSLCGPTLAAIAAGVVLYFALSRLPATARAWHAAAGLAVLAAAAVAAYFISQYGHLGYTEKVGGVDHLAAWLGGGAPSAGEWAPDRNSVAASLEGVFFLAIALAVTRRHGAARAAWGVAVVMLAAALALSASRGAWLAIGVAAVVWVAIRLRWCESKPAVISVLAVAPLVAGLVWLVAIAWWPDVTGSGAVAPVLNRPDRVTIYRQAAMLIRDCPVTGIGLGGQFAMTLSRYVLLIQVPYLTYSHNLYLETWLELGLAGAAALVWLLSAFVTSFRTLPQLRNRTLAEGAGIGVLAILLHGMVDARQYVDLWTALPLFALLGLYTAAVSPGTTVPLRRGARLASAIAVSLFLLLALGSMWPPAAAWHANAGAVRQAQAELGKPASAPPDTAALEDAGASFRRALAADPRNVTANLRLALMDMDAGRFDAAAGHAASAWNADRSNPAARKALGLASVWVGDLDRARPLLERIPGIVDELNVWGWWRASQRQPQLALRAYRMSLSLNPAQSSIHAAADAITASRPPGSP